MTSPRHLWSGDWRRDSDAAAAELAKRRADGGAVAEGEMAEGPATLPRTPAREPRGARIAAALRGARGRLPAFGPERRRVALLIALSAVILAGAVYGLAQIGGSGGTPAAASTGRPWLGVEVSMPPGGGVIVDSVAPHGPAQRAGIEPGDVILQIGNQPVSSPADVDPALRGLHPGDSIPVTVLRGADSYTTLATVAGAPAGSVTP